MKRTFALSSEKSNQDKKMRKAAVEQKDLVEMKSVFSDHSYSVFSEESLPSPSVKFNSKGTPMFTLDSVPRNMVHLGSENFVSVNRFLGQTRVHIRRYVCDKDGFYQPTKDGVSLSPSVWLSLNNYFAELREFKPTDQLVVVDKDLCVSKETTEDNEQVFAFQRLYQRKDKTFHFVPERVVLTREQFLCLDDPAASQIMDYVKESLIKYSLSYFIYMELKKPENNQSCKDFVGIQELTDSLGKCIALAIASKITEIIECFACHESFMHNCLHSRADKFDEYFVKALLLVNWKNVACDFVRKNINVDIFEVFAQAEYFDVVDVNKLFTNVQKLYVGEEEIVFQ